MGGVLSGLLRHTPERQFGGCVYYEKKKHNICGNDPSRVIADAGEYS